MNLNPIISIPCERSTNEPQRVKPFLDWTCPSIILPLSVMLQFFLLSRIKHHFPERTTFYLSPVFHILYTFWIGNFSHLKYCKDLYKIASTSVNGFQPFGFTLKCEWYILLIQQPTEIIDTQLPGEQQTWEKYRHFRDTN